MAHYPQAPTQIQNARASRSQSKGLVAPLRPTITQQIRALEQVGGRCPSSRPSPRTGTPRSGRRVHHVVLARSCLRRPEDSLRAGPRAGDEGHLGRKGKNDKLDSINFAARLLDSPTGRRTAVPLTTGGLIGVRGAHEPVVQLLGCHVGDVVLHDLTPFPHFVGG